MEEIHRYGQPPLALAVWSTALLKAKTYKQVFLCNHNFFSFTPQLELLSFLSQAYNYHMSPGVRKPKICICENEADQLRGNRKADQRLCFRYLDSIVPLIPKYKISSL